MNKSMRKLTLEEIRLLASKPGVRKTAVENFLFSMGTDYVTAMNNLRLDLSLYKWNKATVNAIKKGISLATTTQQRRRQKKCL